MYTAAYHYLWKIHELKVFRTDKSRTNDIDINDVRVGVVIPICEVQAPCVHLSPMARLLTDAGDTPRRIRSATMEE
jgi:hypothetical protein